MAQIVTITNPLTGQPAQVDQLDHTAQQIDDAIGRALPGGEIDSLLSGKAPAGYGLGGIAKILTSSDDLNNIKTTGWYCYHRSKQPANVPTPEVYSAVMEVIFGNFSGQTVQRVYSTGDNKDWNLVAQRVSYGSGGWQPWEWLNPPMILGVEYRTTERYQGKPVYVKLVDFGALPNATAKAVNFSIKNNSQLLECKGFLSGGGVLPYSYPGSSVGTANVYTNKSSGSFGVIVITDKDLSGQSAYFILKYTKTTD